MFHIHKLQGNQGTKFPLNVYQGNAGGKDIAACKFVC